MLLSNSVNNGDDPISSVDLSFLQNPFVNEEDHLHLPISFFHFPSPFEDNDAFLPPNQELFLRHLQQSLLKPSETPSIPNNHKAVHTTPKDHQIPRRKSSRKDRHSKINTLKGPRDRRMRLSLPVARDLFGLQDMLGVDKASKTVEWLLIQSKAAIKKLKKELDGGQSKSPSSLSDSEVVSGIDEDHSIKGNQPLPNKEKKKRRIKQLRRLSFHPSSKESREKARARARARTEKKHQTRSSIAIFDDPPDRHNQKWSCDLSRVSSSLIGFETGEESGGTQSNIINPCLEVLAETDQPTSSNSITRKLDQLVNDSSMITYNWSPSSIFSSLHSTGFSPQEYQFGEFPIVEKSWNFYETRSLY